MIMLFFLKKKNMGQLLHPEIISKKIIAVSNATKQEIITELHADPNKVIVTYEGASIGVDSSESGVRSQFPMQNPFFLYVGNAYPHKNLNKLLAAFAVFHKEVTH